MAISLKHAFTSAKGDGGDTTVVRPSNWNEEHVLTLATSRVLGRISSGSGAAEELTGSDLATLIGNAMGITGEVKIYAGSSAPSGWLLCAGQEISRTTYAALFAVVGTTYGSGDGSTTFNLPDLRGRLPVGKDDMNGTAANRVTTAVSGVDGITLGSTGGDQQFTLAETNIPAHTHSFSGTTSSDGAHTHTFTHDTTGAQSGGTQIDDNTTTSSSGTTVTTSSNGAHTHTVSGTTGSTGSTTAKGHMPPVQVVNYIIKT